MEQSLGCGTRYLDGALLTSLHTVLRSGLGLGVVVVVVVDGVVDGRHLGKGSS